MKKYFALFGMLFFSVLLMDSCSAGAGDGSLSPADFKSSIEKKNAVLVDVRTPEEYSEGHIEGATLINYQDEAFQNTVLSKLPKDAEVLLYCRSGRRSADAKSLMLQLGYKSVAHLDGGISAWESENFPVVK